MQSRRELFYSTICGDVPEVFTRSGRPVRLQTRDGVELFHRDWGSGRPIVFVHSLSMSTAMWGYQEAFLSNHGFRCVSFDRRGHGRSGASAPGADLNTSCRSTPSMTSRRSSAKVFRSAPGADAPDRPWPRRSKLTQRKP